MTQISTINTIIVIGILAAIALPAYQDYIAKTQASEAYTLSDGLKTTIATTRESGACFPATGNGVGATSGKKANEIQGKYGKAVISGTPDTSALNDTDPSGCIITWTAGNTGVSDRIQGKTIELNVLNNGSVKKKGGTIDDKYVPTAVK